MQIPLRRKNEPFLLDHGHAVGAAAESPVASKSDFRENQDRTIPHDQVDFPAAGSVITLQRYETTFVQN